MEWFIIASSVVTCVMVVGLCTFLVWDGRQMHRERKKMERDLAEMRRR